MKIRFIILLSLFFLIACKNNSKDTDKTNSDSDSIEAQRSRDTVDYLTENQDTFSKDHQVDTSEVDMRFSAQGFKDKKYYELLIETHLCDPSFDKSNPGGKTPCSSRLFKFYPYNHKRDIKNSFMLQVKAGVNNYPYRRLLIFVRENGKLILMNGIVGYLVERIAQPNDIDDLVVAVIDDLGNDNFSRYDVLLHYENGKYHFVEALGDLHGDFDTPELKKRASKEIKERINEKELIF